MWMILHSVVNSYFHEYVIKELKNTFQISAHASGSFKYLGLEVMQTAKGVRISQDSYIPNIEPIELSQSRASQKSNELKKEEKAELKRLSGQMMWVTSQTRPDLGFETCVMSNTGKHPNIKMIHEANKAVTKLKSKNLSLNFPNLGDPNKLKVIAYSDATYASLEGGSSQGGLVI